MRQVLELCIQMNELASSTYQSLSERVDDPEVTEVFRVMSTEEQTHASWWADLLEAYDNGLLPDIWADTGSVRAEMTDILEAMRASTVDDGQPISADNALMVAVNIEFFMLDPMFGELLDLAEPAGASTHHDAYEQHIQRLVDAVEKHYRGKAPAPFLARVLQRSWRENRSLAHYAMRDPLTGLGNRRAFGARAKQWIAWSCRYGRPLSVVLIDMDRFRDVNDLHGRAAGDDLLVRVAKALRGVTRASDMIARYGGDEFGVLAPETDPEEARALADRILAAVRGLEMSFGTTVVHPTVSIGTAVMLEPPDSDARDADELLAAADQGIYAAKQAGRDRASDPTILLAPIV